LATTEAKVKAPHTAEKPQKRKRAPEKDGFVNELE
jgi:hypothetical protein